MTPSPTAWEDRRTQNLTDSSLSQTRSTPTIWSRSVHNHFSYIAHRWTHNNCTVTVAQPSPLLKVINRQWQQVLHYCVYCWEDHKYQVSKKTGQSILDHNFAFADRFSKFFHSRTQQQFFNKLMIKHSPYFKRVAKLSCEIPRVQKSSIVNAVIRNLSFRRSFMMHMLKYMVHALHLFS